MVKISDILEVLITSSIISLLITPFMGSLASKIGYLDAPKDNKRHAHSTPLLGGVAIFLAFFIGILSQWDVVGTSTAFNHVLSMLSGVVILLIVGLIDDKIGMGPNIKLFAQFAAAMIMYKSGLRITFLGNYYLSLVATYVWLIGITNAFNLLDNMNGLSSGVAAIAAFFFGVIAWMNGQGVIAIIAFCLCGACLGFLRYNFPKAKIFMGDAGSLIIGFVLASLAIMGSWKTYGLITSLAVPVLVLAYPIFDTTLVTIVRIMEKRSIFQGGKDHSSHRIALLGLKTKNAVLVIYLLCILLGLCGIVVTRVSFISGLSLLLIVGTTLSLLGIRLSLVGTGRFGRKKGVKKIEKR